MKKKVIIGILLAALLVGGVSTTVLAFGQDQPACPNGPNPAEVLGMTVQELRDEIRSGKSLVEILDEKGLDYKTFKEQWLAQIEVCLAEAVAAGKITEDQAQLVLDRLTERLADGRFPYQHSINKKSMHSFMRYWRFMMNSNENMFEDMQQRMERFNNRSQFGECPGGMGHQHGRNNGNW